MSLLAYFFIVTFLISFVAIGEAPSSCKVCHEGIEVISDVEDMANLDCTDCHKGRPSEKTAEKAHMGMYANPSDLRVINETCGQCHEEHIDRMKKSLHATSAGVISGTRYTWGAQKTKKSLYANYAVTDADSNVPTEKGAVKSLEPIPTFQSQKEMSSTNHPSDDYLRNQCLRCHIWSGGAEQEGDYRASGCGACHVQYDNDGLYKGADKAIDKGKKGRPRLHRISKKINSWQCQHCHNRGGRTGTSFTGMMEADPYGSPWSEKPGVEGAKKLHGKFYNHLQADVHFQKGMECIDCHTSLEIHGDGNIYQKQEQAVEIECTDCHGTITSYSNLKTSWGNKLTHLHKSSGKVILTSKVSGKKHIIPQVKDLIHSGSELCKTAKNIPAHMGKMECYACHARWAPQCYGCHTQQNVSSSSIDWLNNKTLPDPSKMGKKAEQLKTTYEWLESRSYLRWENPVLGINAEGKVAPFIPGCQVVFTQTNKDGKATLLNKIFETFDGKSGLAHNPIQPHTISKASRTCEDCHSSPKALGLGSGLYNSKLNGINVDFELERIVDESGKQLQATSHEGVRPFNKEEQDRIRRVNVCASCHQYMGNQKFWQKVKDIYGSAKSDNMHKEILRHIFRSISK